jgi:predicted O-linked N-acetylglucosamine transferase (SPINDLY family)/SAM-dependent methyltransferase
MKKLVKKACPQEKIPPSPKSLPQTECDQLGVLFNSGRYMELEGRTRVLVEQFPDSGIVWKALGASLQMQGKEALPALQRAAEFLPDDAAAQCNLGSELRSLGQLDAAVSRFRRALEIKPEFADAHNNLGAALQDIGQLDEAVACYRRAVQTNPDFTIAHNNLGVSLHHLGQPDAAAASFRRVLELDPNCSEAHSNLAGALRDIGQLADAAVSYRRALEIKPDFVLAHNRLGVTLRDLGQLEAAAASHRRALEIDPDHVSAHNNLGVALRDLGQLDAAMTSYRRALEIDPDFAPAYINLGVALEDLWQLDDAVASFRRALQIKPDSADVSSNLLCIQHYLAEHSAASLLAEARRFGDLVAQQARVCTDWANIPESERCLRVGLVSPDFRNHPVGYFLESILAALMSNAAGRLEITAYMTNIYTDAATERIKAYCHTWHSAVGFSDENLVRRIREDGIDILIDLSGHTVHNRLPLFAWKPVPVQVSWLGYFATTGLAAMDYLIADPWTLPEAEEANFTEKIWRLPETRLCFTSPGEDVQVAPLPALVNGHVTFGCFHNLNKINDAVVALWARVLQAVPSSCLFLKAKQFCSAEVQQRITDRFAANGIDVGRLIFEGSSPRVDYLAAYQRVDITLDPFPFPGGTTTVESLWMGVPVLTLAGTSFLSRQGVGLLMNAGLPDWIAADADDYVTRAVAHASDLPRLASLREGLRQQVLDSPLFDAPRFAGHFEAALRGMWREWCSKQSLSSSREILPQVETAQLVGMFNAGRYAELETQTRLLIDQSPDLGIAWKLLGAALQVQGKEALPALQRAAKLLPDDAEAQNNLGVALVDCGKANEAMANFHRALEIKPDYAGAHNSLGGILKVLGHLDVAVASLRRALEIDPDFAQAHCNLGTALQELGQLDDAVASYRRALEINPDDADTHNNLGTALNDLGRLEDAVASYRRALRIKPDYAEVQSNLLFIHNYLADQSAASLLVEAHRYGDLAAKKACRQTDWDNIPEPDRCLRVGLVSGDMRNHPVGHFVDGVLTALSSIALGRLELFGYANHYVTDALTERIKACCHGWRSAVGLSDESLARLIRDDGIDILIDLVGHTAHNRLSMFAWKPAPVQVSWLGYFATTGVTAIDYLLADPWTLPETEEVYFTEKIWRLPETRLCFTPPEVDIEIAPLPALNNGYVTFGCFNNLTKMNDAVVALWARVLDAVPDSRLFLKATQLNDASVRKSVAERFVAKGVGANRLVLEGASPSTQYFAAYNQVDIGLDPFPYPGGATTVDSLWMGVPVLTLAGTSFLSRQGVGLLMNADLPGWIAADADDYVARAVSHATDVPGLATLRAGLRQQVLDSPIFDALRFAFHLEAALRGMWQTWCAGRTGVTKQGIETKPMKTFLHVGCGPKHKDQTTRGFNVPEWNELRLDINEAANPDIVGTMLDMSAVADESVDALFSHHNIEHLYAHEVPVALAEFRRVLKSDGFVVIACPDLQSVCQLIAEDKLTEPAYDSPAGPITPLDILYGHRPSLQRGNLYMAHRCGFTEKVLIAALQGAGFGSVVSGSRGHPAYDLWALASKEAQSEAEMAALAEAHFPE